LCQQEIESEEEEERRRRRINSHSWMMICGSTLQQQLINSFLSLRHNYILQLP
jgi:hypothetical protein